MINRGWLTALAVGAAALAAGGCGSGDDDSAAANRRADPQEGPLKFARCMRDHGVDMPDPQFSGNSVRIEAPRGVRPDDPAVERAQKACQKYLKASEPKLTAAQKAEAQERFLKYARCMREHGIDIPDNAAKDGKVIFKRGEGGPDPEDPAFQRAQKACMQGSGGPGLSVGKAP